MKSFKENLKNYLQVLNNNRPNEVYYISVILFLFMFLDGAQIFDADFDDVFRIKYSMIYEIFEGAESISDHAMTLYWISLIFFVFTSITKAKKISKWLWNEI